LKKKIGVVCGGSGSSKFVTALTKFAAEEIEPGFVANVSDNFWHRGLYVCPDVDIVTYALAGLLNQKNGWGLSEDTLQRRKMMSRLSREKEWFSLGDQDSAVCSRRTQLYHMGWSLSSITREVGSMLGAKYPVIPSTNESVQTYIRTVEGNLHLQEFWVKNEGMLDAFDVYYMGLENANPAPGCLESLSGSVLLCPANPVTSILPTVNLKRVRSRLKKSRVVAVSPFVGDRPFSGPAGELMKAIGIESNSLGVAKLYSDFLDVLFVDKSENHNLIGSIRELGIECIVTKTKIDSEQDKSSIAKELVAAL
jgi:LPPG:FO 2-phospho-L-lactate transferase